ncbi:LPS-assembly protein LptD [Pararhizobium sp.]|uniref:LPS-assembly protein LptD n=1 Tax=Pararhizobium sp. TaxID=1977563 RepID=UPI0027160F16|nr:LPS-assembly protein LptD [Pararhizobium sp.]MDO9417574.1 LPS-assembly protein LptD [Pararhizobium sp.]
MAVGNRKTCSILITALFAGAALHTLISYGVTAAGAQDAAASMSAPNVSPDAKLLLSAQELIYNSDAEKVTASGSVQIDYSGYKMVARRVEYNQKTGRLMASGEIELIDPTGTRLYADELDVTDTFGQGFINALRVETTDNTRLAAESGERISETEMILNNGVYTACLPCAEKPEKAPLWQVKAKRIIQDGKKKTVRLEHARFELFGMPIAYLPVIELPDQNSKRKSGFLFPSVKYVDTLGFGVSVPYYYAISPYMDATVTGTGLTTQGFLLEAEFRQKFHNGAHTLRVAGIDQISPETFTPGTSDALVDQRGMISSSAAFTINPRWSFGWNVMVQSDNNFARTFELEGLDGSTYVNQGYLTGLGSRNYFDLRAFYFDVQDADPTSASERKQPVAQVMDYSYTAPQPVLGGELNIDTNLTHLYRDNADNYTVAGTNRFRGLQGSTTRFTTEAEWKRTFIAPGGLVLTPLLAARGDAFSLNMTNPGAAYTGNYNNSDSATRSMLTAGLEARYPILMSTATSTHILEPVGQIYARPSEKLRGGLPNEDAQSFVFDAASLFERDKYSGFDRVEGGTRANVGLRYTGTFDSGYSVRGVAGQSFHLAGINSFATDDLVKVGADSGLETDRSDYVASIGLDTPTGFSMTAGTRLDEKTLDLRRADASIGYQNSKFQTTMTYTRIAAQPVYGSNEDADEIQTAAALKFHDDWTVFGSVTYDLNNNNLSKNGIGISYDDECTIFSVVYEQTRDANNSQANDWSIGARLSFRTLGDINVGEAAFTGLN